MNRAVKPGYRPQAADTCIETETDVYFFSRLRQLSLQQRIAQASAHDRSIRKFCLAGIKWQPSQKQESNKFWDLQSLKSYDNPKLLQRGL
jgi:hypothetical protein